MGHLPSVVLQQVLSPAQGQGAAPRQLASALHVREWRPSTLLCDCLAL